MEGEFNKGRVIRHVNVCVAMVYDDLCRTGFGRVWGDWTYGD